MNLLQHIAQSRHLLRKSELKVADHVLLDPASVMHSSMAELAHSVGISEPTIVRFCRAIGCTGFQDLKLKLAQSLAAGASFGQFAIHEDDSVADFSLKIFDTTLHTLIEVREKLDTQALQQAIAAIATQAHSDERGNDGISIKLSALHPRYEDAQHVRVMAELVPRVWALCEQAAQARINLTIDAEEVDRLELSLEVFEALPYAMAVGDAYILIPGCRKRIEDCRDKWANVPNFGGFPDVPTSSVYASRGVK